MREGRRAVLTSWASSHLSRFSSASRLLMIWTKFWKEKERGLGDDGTVTAWVHNLGLVCVRGEGSVSDANTTDGHQE